jgi:hypothetical protein
MRPLRLELTVDVPLIGYPALCHSIILTAHSAIVHSDVGAGGT